MLDSSTSSRLPHYALTDIKRTLGAFRAPSGQRIWGQDTFGCPVDLFELLAEAVVLQSQPLSPDRFRAQIIFTTLAKMKTAVKQDRHDLHEVWRLGITLFVARVFSVPHDTNSLIYSIFSHAQAIVPGTSLCYALSWPLFQAGMSLREEDVQKKDWLLAYLRNNYISLGCVHQKLAGDILEERWLNKVSIGPSHDNTRRLVLY